MVWHHLGYKNVLPRVAGAKRRVTAAESRWQSGAREQSDAAVRKKRRDSDV